MAADKTFLRPLTEADIDTIYSLTSDPRVAKIHAFFNPYQPEGGRGAFL